MKNWLTLELPARIAAVMVAMALVFGGCSSVAPFVALTSSNIGILNAEEAGVEKLKGNIGNTVYFKAVFYETRFNRRVSYVGDKPLKLEPSNDKLIDELTRFKKILIDKTIGIMKKAGFSMVEAEKNPGGDVVFVEMRIAGTRAIPMYMDSSAGTRWYVFHKLLKVPAEIHHWDAQVFKMGFVQLYDDQFAGDIAERAANDLVKVLGVSSPQIEKVKQEEKRE